MGCWYGTCGVTQLAIHAGDPVVVFLLAKAYDDKWAQNGHCYSTDYWSPFSLHIRGTYNDYGSLEGVDETDWDFRFTVDRIRRNLSKDVEIDKNNLTWEAISESIHEDQLALAVSKIFTSVYPNLKKQPIGTMAVHKRIFDAIVHNAALDTWSGRTITLESLIEDGRKIITTLREKSKAIKSATTKKDRDHAEFIFQLELERFQTIDRENNLAKIVISNEGSSYNIGREYISFISKKVIDDAPDEELETYIERLAEFYIFDLAMSRMRKTWMPQAGAGSQHDEIDLHNIVNAITKMILIGEMMTRTRTKERPDLFSPIFFSGLILVVVFTGLWSAYDNGWIWAPKYPVHNEKVLSTWSIYKIRRLAKHLDCYDLTLSAPTAVKNKFSTWYKKCGILLDYEIKARQRENEDRWKSIRDSLKNSGDLPSE